MKIEEYYEDGFNEFLMTLVIMHSLYAKIYYFIFSLIKIVIIRKTFFFFLEQKYQIIFIPKAIVFNLKY